MDTKQAVLDILNELTGEDLSDQMDENIFENGLLDSMATVQMWCYCTSFRISP